MDFISKLGETLSEAGHDISRKAKDLTETTKMDIDIRSKESYINKQYASMGKKYFELHEYDQEPLFEEIELIREAKAEIVRMQELMAEKKGMKKCASCQAIIQQEVQFCPHCGTKCETPAKEEPMEDIFVEEEPVEAGFDEEGASKVDFDEEGPSKVDFDEEGSSKVDFDEEGPSKVDFDEEGSSKVDFD